MHNQLAGLVRWVHLYNNIIMAALVDRSDLIVDPLDGYMCSVSIVFIRQV